MSACGRPRVDVELPLMLVSVELVGVTGDEDVDVQLPLHHGQTLHLAPGHHLVAVTQPDAELAHSHYLLLRVVHVLLTVTFNQHSTCLQGGSAENSMPAMSASVKRRLIRALTMTKLQRDDYHLLSRKQQVILVRLRTGHNRLNSHMHRKLKLAPSPACPCGQEEQTTEHVLQRCPLYKATREDVWPDSTSLMTKLYGCKQELEKTTPFIS